MTNETNETNETRDTAATGRGAADASESRGPFDDNSPRAAELLAARYGESEAVAETAGERDWCRDVEAIAGLLDRVPVGRLSELGRRELATRVLAQTAEDGAPMLEADPELARLLDLVEPPAPDPIRRAGLRDRVLAQIALEDSAPVRRRGRLTLLARIPAPLRAAAAVLLMVGVTALVLGRRTPPTGRQQILTLESRAREALGAGRLARAERLLQQVIRDGAGRQDCHRTVAAALNELEAVRLYAALPADSKARRPALARLIYRCPSSRLTPRAMAEYAQLDEQRRRDDRRRPGAPTRPSSLRDFQTPDLPRSAPGALVLGPNGEFQLRVFLRHGEPFIRDAANLHLAMRALESEDLDGALRRFRAVEGPGPASRLAEAEIERLTAGR